MNKTELVNAIADKSGLTKKDSELFLNNYIETVEETVANGDKVQIVGFGTFEPVDRAEREGTNPRTKEKIIIPASKLAKFKVGKGFKDRVNDK